MKCPFELKLGCCICSFSKTQCHCLLADSIFLVCSTFILKGNNISWQFIQASFFDHDKFFCEIISFWWLLVESKKQVSDFLTF